MGNIGYELFKLVGDIMPLSFLLAKSVVFLDPYLTDFD